HHLFDAADSAFSLHLTGREGVDLRRWIRGAENSRRVRARGLQKRVGELAEGREGIKHALDEAMHSAEVLAGENWIGRVSQAAPSGPMENFLGYVRAQVMARSGDRNGPHSLEASAADPVDGMVEAATQFGDQLGRLSNALAALAVRLRRLLDDEADELEANERMRIDSLSRSVAQRAEAVSGWCAMLEAIGGPTPDGLVDWVAVERIEGREIDIGLMRHYVDPTKPFSEVVLEEADGVLITSATLRDRRVAEDEGNWQSADVRTGASHLVAPPQRASFSSPFDYEKNTRVFIVTDVPKNDSQAVAAAYRALFFASRGGALGLFTAIRRLREVYHRLTEPMEQAGIALL
ncbi:MAG: ATP-dependent DNA helicase, partial [Sphingomonadales bacterium]|nr:ATP-dependent DNA helicase [Sphingomonadales bacterium]